MNPTTVLTISVIIGCLALVYLIRKRRDNKNPTELEPVNSKSPEEMVVIEAQVKIYTDAIEAASTQEEKDIIRGKLWDYLVANLKTDQEVKK